jgi:hypothetical protein
MKPPHDVKPCGGEREEDETISSGFSSLVCVESASFVSF